MTYNFSALVQESVARIQTMRYQENTTYATSDYFYIQSQKVAQHHTLQPEFIAKIDADSRTKIVNWCYQIIEFCQFDREIVEYAMSYFDRFMMTSVGAKALHDHSYFQLTCLTCLYTAVKIHEFEAMDPALVSKLSYGLYTCAEIEAMEVTILNAINWRVNPPTSLSFVREFLQIVPDALFDIAASSSIEEFHETLDCLIRMQTELSVQDYRYVTIKPSYVAYCAFMNSIETLIDDDKVVGCIGCILAEAICIDCNSPLIVHVQNHLYESILQKPLLQLERSITTYSSKVCSDSRYEITNSPRNLYEFSCNSI